jgi:excisionase family DNA binding protein
MIQLLNLEDIACRLGISVWTVRSLVRCGKLAPTRIGRRVLVSESELEQFVRRCSEYGETTNPAHEMSTNHPG